MPLNLQNGEQQTRSRISYLNVGSLTELKLQKITDLLKLENLDVLAIAETSRNELPCKIEGYRVVCIKQARKESLMQDIVIARERLNITALEDSTEYGVAVNLLVKCSS